jgi:hypothetical protein
MSFRDLTGMLRRYSGTSGELVNGFYVPVLREAVQYDRQTGYFDSASLVQISAGLAAFIQRVRNLPTPPDRKSRMRLVTGATWEPDDIAAYQRGQSALQWRAPPDPASIVVEPIRETGVQSFLEAVDADVVPRAATTTKSSSTPDSIVDDRPPTPKRRSKRGFTHAEYLAVVQWIEVASEPQTATELAELSEVDRPTVVRVVKYLEKCGVVIRQRSKGGRGNEVKWVPQFDESKPTDDGQEMKP